jgi:DNA polymerase-3 subunit epsilon
MRQIFLDTETTGLWADQGDRVVEIGCVELLNRKPTGNNFHVYINPERDSHEDAFRIHGITTEFLRDKPKFAALADDFLAYVRGAHVVIHNASFDTAFLDAELARLGHAPLSKHVSSVLDTLALAKEMFPGKRNSLDALCSRLGVDNSGRTLHGALLDAELLAEVYIHLTRGQDALLIDSEGPALPGAARTDVDLRGFDLPVIAANAHETAAHLEVLAQIDKSSGGKTRWPKTA